MQFNRVIFLFLYLLFELFGPGFQDEDPIGGANHQNTNRRHKFYGFHFDGFQVDLLILIIYDFYGFSFFGYEHVLSVLIKLELISISIILKTL